MIRPLLLAATLVFTPLTAAAMDMVMAGKLKIMGAHTYATAPTAKTAAGYLMIENTGDTDDTLLTASGPQGMVQLHKTETDSAGVSTMQHQENGIPLPAGETVTLEPGGLHIMFMGLSAPFAEGEMVTITLTFAEAGEVELMLPVVARGEGHGHGAHKH